ncbi:hypothetical protein FOA52_006474 [Chlamydomonas sp. UWO 241]|nr:hypothetical protein FOA52_006474 [Chlamydomonas sp. UWO 241]
MNPPPVVGSNEFGLDHEMFTGKAAARSEQTMVSMHLEKMQAEKENLAIQKLSALMPQMGGPVLVAALQEAVFDVDTALTMLRRFSTEHEEQLKALYKKRSRLVAQAKEEAELASSSSSESEPDSEDGEPDRKRSKSSKSGKSSKGSKHSKKRSSKDRGKDRKRDKHSGKEAKAKTLTAGESFGKYGIIRETDANAKSAEFILWALEVRKRDVETIRGNDEKELFRDYIEDYNTGTLPHRKYYNLEAYEKYKAAKAAAKGGPKKSEQRSSVDDEADLRRQRVLEAARIKEARQQDALAALKYGDKAKDMKEQELLRLQMQTAYKTGNKALAEKLMARLAPDDPVFKK